MSGFISLKATINVILTRRLPENAQRYFMSRLRLSESITILAAAAVLAAACSRDPEAAKRDHLRRGDQYLKDKQYSAAIIEYRNVVQADPRSGEGRRKLADAYLASGEFDNGFREYIRAADLLPNDTDVQLTVGGLRLVGRQFDDARGIAEKILARTTQRSGHGDAYPETD